MPAKVRKPADDIMPASFAYALIGSVLLGVALWGGVLLLLM